MKMEIGILGLGLARGISELFTFFGMNIYPFFIKDIRQSMRLPTKEVFQDLTEYLYKGIPLSLMMCFEWMAFDFLVIMCGSLGVAQQATQTIFINCRLISLCLPSGFQSAIACLVGNEIGKRDVE